MFAPSPQMMIAFKGVCRIAACNAWVSWSSDLADMHAHQPLGPRASGVPDMSASITVHSICTRVYIHCCLAQWGIYWFSRVMHAAVRFAHLRQRRQSGRECGWLLTGSYDECVCEWGLFYVVVLPVHTCVIQLSTLRASCVHSFVDVLSRVHIQNFALWLCMHTFAAELLEAGAAHSAVNIDAGTAKPAPQRMPCSREMASPLRPCITATNRGYISAVNRACVSN